MKENIGIKGSVELVKVSPDGNKEVRKILNTIVNTGKSVVAGLIVNDVVVGSQYDYIAIGLGSSTIAATDVILGSEYNRVNTDGATVTTTTTNDTSQFIGSFSIDATKSINEAGIFNNATFNVGSMLSRTTFTPINAISGDSINATWKIQFS